MLLCVRSSPAGVLMGVLGSAHHPAYTKDKESNPLKVREINFTHEGSQAACAKVFTLSGVFLSVEGNKFFFLFSLKE